MQETLGEELCKSIMDTKVEEQREGKEAVILVNFYSHKRFGLKLGSKSYLLHICFISNPFIAYVFGREVYAKTEIYC